MSHKSVFIARLVPQKGLDIILNDPAIKADIWQGDMPPPREILLEKVHGIDGLYVDAGSLLAVQNGAGRERIVRYRLAPEGDRIEGLAVLDSRNPLFRIPTTGVVAGSDFVYLANPNLEALDDEGRLKKDAHVEDVVVLRAPLR